MHVQLFTVYQSKKKSRIVSNFQELCNKNYEFVYKIWAMCKYTYKRPGNLYYFPPSEVSVLCILQSGRLHRIVTVTRRAYSLYEPEVNN